jgi:hypothetical protein
MRPVDSVQLPTVDNVHWFAVGVVGIQLKAQPIFGFED